MNEETFVCVKPMGASGRIVIPSILRERFNIGPGTLLSIAISNDGLLLRPVVGAPTRTADNKKNKQ